jgi:hypothetical protein
MSEEDYEDGYYNLKDHIRNFYKEFDWNKGLLRGKIQWLFEGLKLEWLSWENEHFYEILS